MNCCMIGKCRKFVKKRKGQRNSSQFKVQCKVISVWFVSPGFNPWHAQVITFAHYIHSRIFSLRQTSPNVPIPHSNNIIHTSPHTEQIVHSHSNIPFHLYCLASLLLFTTFIPTFHYTKARTNILSCSILAHRTKLFCIYYGPYEK